MQEGKNKRDRLKKLLPFRQQKQRKSTPTATVKDVHESKDLYAIAGQATRGTVESGRSQNDVYERHSGLRAKEIWQTAFDELRASESTERLVVEYEEFLRPHLSVVTSCSNGKPLPS